MRKFDSTTYLFVCILAFVTIGTVVVFTVPDYVILVEVLLSVLLAVPVFVPAAARVLGMRTYWDVRRYEDGYEYEFRNLPFTAVSEGRPWFVSGTFQDGDVPMSGVLEWCYCEQDAKFLLGEMRKDSRMMCLVASNYVT